MHAQGHGPTQLDSQWLSAKAPYRVDYLEGYEPYVVAKRQSFPSFDPRFRGYGLNKVGGREYVHTHMRENTCYVHAHKRENTCSLVRTREYKLHDADNNICTFVRTHAHIHAPKVVHAYAMASMGFSFIVLPGVGSSPTNGCGFVVAPRCVPVYACVPNPGRVIRANHTHTLHHTHRHEKSKDFKKFYCSKDESYEPHQVCACMCV